MSHKYQSNYTVHVLIFNNSEHMRLKGHQLLKKIYTDKHALTCT
jgi:hypothetical protein